MALMQYAITILLGLALYLMSFQFISSKQLPLIDKLSRYIYALSLSIPVAYVLLWILTFLIDLLANYLKLIPPNLMSSIAGVIVGYMLLLLCAKPKCF